MLRVDFINVGDGDAILLREEKMGITHTVLVDCGRPHVEFVAGSKRSSCLDYLMREGIEKIDLMVVTHLHFDHMGGALAVLRHFPVAELVALYLPPKDARWICRSPRENKTVVGMCDSLNMWNDTVCVANGLGTKCREAVEAECEIGNIRLHMYLPDAALVARQKAVFHALYRAENFTDEALVDISKERNPSSLILRAEYAGRSLLLTGDSYAVCWQDKGIAPCDILKLPHHGDGKSMTEPLLRSLSPTYAVVSCQNNPESKKDRPNAQVLEMLLRLVPYVLCTENKPFPNYPARTHSAIRFLIEEDGSVYCG